MVLRFEYRACDVTRQSALERTSMQPCRFVHSAKNRLHLNIAKNRTHIALVLTVIFSCYSVGI